MHRPRTVLASPNVLDERVLWTIQRHLLVIRSRRVKWLARFDLEPADVATQLLIDNETRGREPGAYVAYSGKLYCVEYWEVTGPRQGTLHCIDARSGYCVALTREQAAAATFIRGPAIEPPSPRRSLDVMTELLDENP